MKHRVDVKQSKALQNLLYQTLETEIGGVDVYRQALQCVKEEALAKEFEKYLEQTQRHVSIAEKMLHELGFDPASDVPARATVRLMGETLVEMMVTALRDDPNAAELTACECVLEAETKDHSNWELLASVVKSLDPDAAKVVKAAVSEVEEDEDEHLYHTQGWAREMWMKALGLPAELPPPEERKHVKTAIGAARAKQSRHPTRSTHA